MVHKQFFTYRWDGFLAKIEEYEGDTLIATTHIIRDDRLALQDRDEANNILREYTWGKSMGGGIGGLLNLHQQEASYSYLYDGKGNVTGILDGSENMVASYAYNAFGKVMNISGTLE